MVKIKKHVVLEREDDDSIKLVCAEEAPLGKIWDALNEFRAVIFEQIEIQKAAEEKKEEEVVEPTVES